MGLNHVCTAITTTTADSHNKTWTCDFWHIRPTLYHLSYMRIRWWQDLNLQIIGLQLIALTVWLHHRKRYVKDSNLYAANMRRWISNPLQLPILPTYHHTAYRTRTCNQKIRNFLHYPFVLMRLERHLRDSNPHAQTGQRFSRPWQYQFCFQDGKYRFDSQATN